MIRNVIGRVAWATCFVLPSLGLTGMSTHAAVRPRISLTVVRHLLATGNSEIIHAGTGGLSGPLIYSFSEEGPSRGWHPLSHGVEPWMKFNPKLKGSYLIRATVMTRSAFLHHQLKKAVTSLPLTLYVGSRDGLTLSSDSVGVGRTMTLKAHSSDVSDVVYQVWIRDTRGHWKPLGPYQSSPDFSYRPTEPGAYTAVIHAKPQGSIANPEGQLSTGVSFHAYGPLTFLHLLPKFSALTADGNQTETVNVEATDAAGNVVSDVSGTATVEDTNPNGALSGMALATAKAAGGVGLPLSVPITDGIGSLALKASTSVAKDKLTVSDLTVDGSKALPGITDTLSVVTEAQVPTALDFESQSTDMMANESGNPANYTLAVDDQAGFPMLAGSYPVTLNIMGPGQFHDLTQGPDTVTYYGGQAPAPLTIYSIAGGLGPMSLTAKAEDLPTKTLTTPAVLGGQPYQMGISATRTTLTSDNSTTTLTLTQLTKTGGLSDPASLDNAGYTVSIMGSDGLPATGFMLDHGTYTGAMTFPVAYGPNYFYAMSQSMTLQDISAEPGTYRVTLSDPSGLLKDSTPLTIVVGTGA